MSHPLSSFNYATNIYHILHQWAGANDSQNEYATNSGTTDVFTGERSKKQVRKGGGAKTLQTVHDIDFDSDNEDGKDYPS